MNREQARVSWDLGRTLEGFSDRRNWRVRRPARGRHEPNCDAQDHALTIAEFNYPRMVAVLRMERALEPELLDTLPASHPDALHNRRDLRLTNIIMRNYAWMRRTLRRLGRPGERVLEVGAGDGELGRQLRRDGVNVDGLDLWDKPNDWPSDARWHKEDVRHFQNWSEYPVIIGNLIFHQFSDTDLREIGARMQTARLIVMCEPERRRASQVAYAAVAPLLGANYVTLHDAHVSIRAGFRSNELAQLLGLAPAAWDSTTTTTVLGAYRLVALRRV